MDRIDLNQEDIQKILIRLDVLEDRIAYLEAERDQFKQVQGNGEQATEESEEEFSDVNISISSLFETKLGEYGLAWLGNIVLFFAIAFLWQYFNDQGKSFVSLVVGLVSVGSVFILSRLARKSFAYLSEIFRLFGFFILYFILLRLHFYTNNPLVTSGILAVSLLLIVIGVLYYEAVHKRSPVLAGIASTLAVITAFVCNSTQPFFLISLAGSALVVHFFWKYNWWKPMVYVLCLTFFTFLVWLLKSHASAVKPVKI